ncbi:RNA polymerase sigma-70 factor (ECF subfamily) [Dyadobacter jejuensis]|uniref:RNA polymerase sigma-70 factor (ECF subfamily) n=1 Tax=Dyadobacter jejuensis TaxID=1082580 RepID=A0A316ATI8_9BACT|nr:RNA polymerase sigma-70 factor [Dyadobacter jejuensis]PWJ60599.1 RNA polymerase sigma-70 factor (ECF subfamily) [Dyadobacter jejuensis]
MRKESISDESLLSRLRKDDQQALASLMDRYFEPLCAYGHVLLHDWAQVEELVADVFFSIWSKREELEIHTSLKSYLFVSVKNKALQQLRKESRMPFQDIDSAADDADSEPNGLERLILQELNQDIIDLVHTLPEKRRIIFELNRFESFTYKEIAELLQISEKTVVNQMSLAIKYLRQYARAGAHNSY